MRWSEFLQKTDTKTGASSGYVRPAKYIVDREDIFIRGVDG